MAHARIIVWIVAIVTIVIVLIDSLDRRDQDVRSAMQAIQVLTEALLWVVVTLGLSYAVTSIISEVEVLVLPGVRRIWGKSDEEVPPNPPRPRRHPRQRGD